jgi:hypothetical protein
LLVWINNWDHDGQKALFPRFTAARTPPPLGAGVTCCSGEQTASRQRRSFASASDACPGEQIIDLAADLFA